MYLNCAQLPIIVVCYSQCYKNQTGHRLNKASGQRVTGRTDGSTSSTADFFDTIITYNLKAQQIIYFTSKSMSYFTKYTFYVQKM